ncbi:hypothetical protein KFE25_009632 [Diacronema lutheri]|uniref:Uncharacterized protein n=1 Tax=Diacronema lutheri TaxID=2081491 RepID=A0A8J5XY66_DIALT|nr:hypothetical protein KFE25_009632 [Diacronema lutheri]
MPGLTAGQFTRAEAGDNAKLLATAASGLLAGALTFVSFVDTRTILRLVHEGESKLVTRYFSVWWPNGRDLMLPLVLTTGALHGAAYALTSELGWLWTAAAATSIGPYTRVVLGEDIAALRDAGTAKVATIARRFCMLHHPRTLIAAATFAVALRSLSTPRR